MGTLVSRYVKELMKELGFELEETGGGCLSYTKYQKDKVEPWRFEYEMLTTESLGEVERADEKILHCSYEDSEASPKILFEGSFSKWLEWVENGQPICWLCKSTSSLYESEACEKCYNLMVNWEEKIEKALGFQVIMTEELARELYRAKDIFEEKVRNYS